MASYRTVFLEFLSRRFGSSIANQLFDIYTRKRAIQNFDAMSLKEQFDFVTYMFDAIFSKFYEQSKIARINISCFLRFALAQAAQRMEQMFNLKTEIDDFTLKAMGGMSEVPLQDFTDKGNVVVNFSFDGAAKAFLGLVHKKEMAVDFSSKLINRMMEGEGSAHDEKMAYSAISEFYNIILPPFTDVIGDTMDVDFSYVPVDTGTLRSQALENQDYAPQQVIFSTIVFKMMGKKYEVHLYCFLEEVKAQELQAFIRENVSQSDIFERNPPQIIAEKTGKRREDLAQFFNKKLNFEYGHLALDKVFDFFQIRNDDDIDYVMMQRIIDRILEQYYTRASENKKANIRANIQYIYDFIEKGGNDNES
ncbi:MAG: hypothetical protein ACOCWQ_05275 [Nanoarchaeota archaeon]